MDEGRKRVIGIMTNVGTDGTYPFFLQCPEAKQQR